MLIEVFNKSIITQLSLTNNGVQCNSQPVIRANYLLIYYMSLSTSLQWHSPQIDNGLGLSTKHNNTFTIDQPHLVGYMARQQTYLLRWCTIKSSCLYKNFNDMFLTCHENPNILLFQEHKIMTQY